MKWNKNDLEQAIKLVKEGFNYIEIGKILNRTTDSVRNKLTRKGYKFTSLNSGRENRFCINCNKEFETTKSNEKIFCNHSCAAIFNNNKKKKSKEVKKCLCCNKELINNNKNIKKIKFCSYSCSGQHKKNEIFKKIENGDTTLSIKNYRNYLIEKYGAKCMDCGWDKVNTKTGLVPIQLEHIDGDSDNNDLKNLKILCPNCHSLTSTFGALNKNGRDSKRKKYRKEWRDKFEKEERKINSLVKKKCKNCNEDFFGKEERVFCSLQCYKIENRKKIPNKEDIIEALNELKSLVNVGKKYGVSDNAVKKWCLIYDIQLKK